MKLQEYKSSIYHLELGAEAYRKRRQPDNADIWQIIGMLLKELLPILFKGDKWSPPRAWEVWKLWKIAQIVIRVIKLIVK